MQTASFTTDEKDYIEQQKRIKELEEIVNDQAIQIHILKKLKN